jgi:hypothetical protein
VSLEILLTKKRFALVDDEDFETLSRLKWHAIVCKNTGYAAHRESSGKYLMMHRFVLRINGLDKEGIVDHRNGNGFDNRKQNLRIGSHSQNLQNQKIHCDKAIKVKGAFWDKNRQKFIASICVNGRQIFLGRFDDLNDAADAYRTAAAVYFGQFARTDG